MSNLSNNYIAGDWVKGASSISNINPSNTNDVIGEFAQASNSQLEDALNSAQVAQRQWAATGLEQRQAVLMKIGEEMMARSAELGELLSREEGKPVAEGKGEVYRAGQFFTYYAAEVLRQGGDTADSVRPNIEIDVRREPMGTVAIISPWNFPTATASWKIAPALAAGNTVVAKPSEVTPMTAYLFSKICIEAGLPKGVLNIVHGLGSKTGDPLTMHPDVPIVSFTGGTLTGKHIASVTAPMFKKLSLEMGGKNPNIVFADADFDKAVSTAARAAFTNQGQICLCGSRLFVQEGIYEKFRDALVAKAEKLKVGDPKDPSSNLGAVVSKDHMEKILSKIEEAKQLGGKILIGGEREILEGDLKNGYYIQPTIIDGLSSDCDINQEEIFGPIVSLIPFKTEEEVVEMANSTKYGLSASIFTENISKGHRVAANIDSGVVWINTWLLRDLRIPFGGMKHSGVGREGGFKSLEFFTESKNVCVKI